MSGPKKPALDFNYSWAHAERAATIKIKTTALNLWLNPIMVNELIKQWEKINTSRVSAACAAVCKQQIRRK